MRLVRGSGPNRERYLTPDPTLKFYELRLGGHRSHEDVG